MKRKTAKLLFKAITITFFTIAAVIFSANANAQGPPPPPGGGGTGTNNGGNQTGGNAPLGGGVFILTGLAAVYGCRKLVKTFSKKDMVIDE